MTSSASARSRRAAGRPLKSPLAVAGGYGRADLTGGAEAAPATRRITLTDRRGDTR